MWESIVFMAENIGFTGAKTVEHIFLTVVAAGLAIVAGVPIGIAIIRSR